MGSRKKAKGKKTKGKKTKGKKTKGKKTSATKSARNEPQKLLRTQFMADFQRTFIFDRTLSGDARFLWPAPGFANKDAMRDLTDVIDVLGARFAAQPLNTSNASTPTFRDRVIQFLTERNWPTGSPVPREYKQSGNENTVHLVEMAVICDRMLEALNEGGSGGGGGSPWPPHIL